MVTGILMGRMDVEPVLPVNNWYDVKPLMDLISVSFGVGTSEQGLTSGVFNA